MPTRAVFLSFKTRCGFHGVKCSGEAKSADKDAAASYPDCLRAIIEEGRYKPQQVFNMDEMGLQWKMPERMYITREEKSAPGFKAFKDLFALLLGANRTGDCKLKPVLVYHAENPRALKGYEKAILPVPWYASSSGWMTGHIFQVYRRTALVHELKEYCTSQGLPFHILMALDSDPNHPHVLWDLHRDIKFIFLPPNTTSLLQPIDQGVIGMFRAHYLQKVWCALSLKCDVSLDELEKAAQAPEKTEVEIQKDVVRRHWWTCTAHDLIWHVRDAWMEVTESCIRGAWKKLCLEFAVDFGGFDLSKRLSEERLELARKVRPRRAGGRCLLSAGDDRRGARGTREAAASVRRRGGGSAAVHGAIDDGTIDS